MQKPKVMRFEDGLGRPVQRSLEPSEVSDILEHISGRTEVIPGSAFAYVHGSFITEGPSKDIDVAIYFTGTSQDIATDHCLAASAILSHELGVPVDVHPIDAESLGFAFGVASGTLLFTKDAQLSDRFEERAVLRYMDFQPILRSVLEDLTAR